MLSVHLLIIIIVILFFISGLIGSVIPSIPGPPLIFVGILIYAIFDGFTHVNLAVILVTLVLAVISLILDYATAALGAKGAKGSNYAVIGTIVGGFLGLIIFHLPGLIIGTFVGAFMAEIVFQGSSGWQALKVGIGSLIGFLAGTVIKLLVCLAMIIIFLTAILA